MADFDLIVTHQFGDRQIGERISGDAADEVLKSHERSVVRVAKEEPAPAAPPIATFDDKKK